jgi:hypothetical protein
VPAPNTDALTKIRRVSMRDIFSIWLGDDNLLHADRFKISAQLTVINLTTKYALYSFLSTRITCPENRNWAAGF